MLSFLVKFRDKKFQKSKNSFSKRYQHCNRCEINLNISNNEEIVCGICGETFCNSCIDKHQKYCYSLFLK